MQGIKRSANQKEVLRDRYLREVQALIDKQIYSPDDPLGSVFQRVSCF